MGIDVDEIGTEVNTRTHAIDYPLLLDEVIGFNVWGLMCHMQPIAAEQYRRLEDEQPRRRYFGRAEQSMLSVELKRTHPKGVSIPSLHVFLCRATLNCFDYVV